MIKYVKHAYVQVQTLPAFERVNDFMFKIGIDSSGLHASQLNQTLTNQTNHNICVKLQIS